MREENADRLLELADREPDELTDEESRELFALGEELRGEVRAIMYPLSVHKCSACGEEENRELDARIIHAKGIHPRVDYCSHCLQYPPSIFRSET